jgi:hypothetical protein
MGYADIVTLLIENENFTEINAQDKVIYFLHYEDTTPGSLHVMSNMDIFCMSVHRMVRPLFIKPLNIIDKTSLRYCYNVRNLLR